MTEKRKRGRPSAYTKRIGDAICRRLAEGESLRSICSGAAMPVKSTVLLWVVDGKHKHFSDQYALAREAAGYSHADDVVDVVRKTGTGEYDAQIARAMMDGLKWAAERMAPKAHSPRQEIDHRSPDGSMSPSRIEIVPGGNGKS